MDLPVTDRRVKIGLLLDCEDYEGLARLGVELFSGPSELDCGGYVLRRLGFPADQYTATVLWEFPRVQDPVPGIVLYRWKDGSNVQQHGVYDGRKVVGQWGRNVPAVRHDIADVPGWAGDMAEFIEVTDEFKGRMQFAVQQRNYDYY